MSISKKFPTWDCKMAISATEEFRDTATTLFAKFVEDVKGVDELKSSCLGTEHPYDIEPLAVNRISLALGRPNLTPKEAIPKTNLINMVNPDLYRLSKLMFRTPGKTVPLHRTIL